MIQIPPYILIVVLLAVPASCIAGCLAGAHIYHRAKSGKGPIPAVPSVERIKKAFRREEKPEEEPKPRGPVLRS